MSEPRTSPEVCGMGHSMKRKEDPRFIRGRGNYVDDIQLPGMLHMDIVRSPFAHAKIKSINADKALKVPGVLAVITGETLAKYNLHWMPTLMSDTQMVLPTEKVMYQAQEVAAVIATDRYVAADGVEAVEVEYDPLPVVVDPFKALDPSAPILRTDKKIRIISPDIGGGFGGKVPVYPGYVIAVAASVVIGKPVKWVEDRMENLQADSFARDYHIHAELAATKDGTMKALRIKTLADHGYTDAAANPSKFPAGLFSICTGSYALQN